MRQAFSYLVILPDTMCKKPKLFTFHGLDPLTSKPVLETDTFDEEGGVWDMHQSHTHIEDKVLQNGFDSGGPMSFHGVVVVGEDIILAGGLLMSIW